MSRHQTSKHTHSFFSNHQEIFHKLAGSVFNWVSVPRYLIGIKMQHLFRLVICWLTCLLEQLVDYDSVQTAEKIPKNFTYRNIWNTWKLWTMSTQNFSILQAFQTFFPQLQSTFLSDFAERFHPISLRQYRQSASWKHAGVDKRTSINL